MPSMHAARRRPSPLSLLLLVACAAAFVACGNDPGGGPIGHADASAGVRLSEQPLPDDLDELGEVEVIHVSDGDTMDIEADGTSYTIRFYGVDTPEKDQPFGQEAKAYTEGLLNGAIVEVRLLPGEVTYGRHVGVVIAGDIVVNAALLDEGFAWFYGQFCERDVPCSAWDQLEDDARSARRGLWASDDPMAPWDWRRRDD